MWVAIIYDLRFARRKYRGVRVVLRLISSTPRTREEVITVFLACALYLNARRLSHDEVFSGHRAPCQGLCLCVGSRLVDCVRHYFQQAPKIRARVVRSVFTYEDVGFFPQDLVDEEYSYREGGTTLRYAAGRCQFFVRRRFISFVPCVARSRDFNYG